MFEFAIISVVTLASIFSITICAVDLQTEHRRSERIRLQTDLIISIIAILITTLALYY